jgi:hypothetical protein
MTSIEILSALLAVYFLSPLVIGIPVLKAQHWVTQRVCIRALLGNINLNGV